MIHAYDKTYLSNAQKNLARMLDYLTNSLHVSLENAWHWFLTSKISMRFECGDCSVLSGMSGVELAFAVLQEAGEPFPVSMLSSTKYSCLAFLFSEIVLKFSVFK